MDIQGADYTSIGTAVSDLDSGYLPGTVVPTSRQRLALYGIILAEMSIEMVTSVLYQRFARNLDGYLYFTSQFCFPIGITLMTAPVAIWQARTGRLTVDERKLDKRWFLLVAALAGGVNLAGSLPAPYLPGGFQVLLSQSGLVIAMAWSAILLRTRYLWSHYLGAACILGGIAIAAYPSLSLPNASSTIIWIVVFLFQFIIPGTVVQELFLKKHAVGLFNFRAWSGVLEIFVGAMLLPTIWIPQPSGATPAVAPADTGTYFVDAVSCFTNIDPPNSHCAGGLPIWLIYMGLGLVHGICKLGVFKYGSAATQVAVSAAMVPLKTMLYQWKWLAGSAQDAPPTWHTYVSIVVVLAGIVMYRLRDERSAMRIYCAVEDSDAFVHKQTALGDNFFETGLDDKETRLLIGDKEE